MNLLPVISQNAVRKARHLLLALSSFGLFSTMAAADARSDYLLHCSGCHLENGSSKILDVPDLRETYGFLSSFAAGREYLVRVPGAAYSPLSDAALAQVMNWMLENFELQQPRGNAFSEDDVSTHRSNPLYNPGVLRESLLEAL